MEDGILQGGVVGMVTVDVRVDQEMEDEGGDELQRYLALLGP